MNNRVIKFRAWDKGESEMIHSSVELHLRLLILQRENFTDIIGFDEEERLNFHFMQFTGLHDKNGVEIYEGDIVKVKLLGTDGKYIGERVGYVSFNEFEWAIEMEDDYFPVASWLLVDSCEVIGNIHENPELIEDTK